MLETVHFVPGNPPTGHETLVAIATRGISFPDAEKQVSILAADVDANRLDLGFLLHATDSTRLSLATRKSLGLPVIAGQGEGSFREPTGPTLLQPGDGYWQKYEELCEDLEPNFWLSRNDVTAQPRLGVFHEMMEVKSEGVVVGMPKQTFEYIDTSGRGHVFLEGIAYKPYPELYQGSRTNVVTLKYLASQAHENMDDTKKATVLGVLGLHYSKSIWIANREFSDKHYSLVEQAVQAYS